MTLFYFMFPPLSALPIVFNLCEGSDRCVAGGVVYTALSALLHCGLSQLVPLAPQLNLIDPSRAGSHPAWELLFIQEHTVTNDWFMRSRTVASCVLVRRNANQKQTHDTGFVCEDVRVGGRRRAVVIQRWLNNVTPIRAHLNVKSVGLCSGTSREMSPPAHLKANRQKMTQWHKGIHIYRHWIWND